MTAPAIGPQTQVTLHFAIKLDDGTEVDSNFAAEPATFTVGDGNLLPGFEQSLFGLQAGEKTTLRILPEQGFGQRNPNNIQKVPRSQFADMALEPGLMISFADAGQSELPGVVSEFDDKQVTVDFNHPLAGRELFFDVQILTVSPV